MLGGCAVASALRGGARPLGRRLAVAAAAGDAAPAPADKRPPKGTGRLRRLPHAPKAKELARRARSRGLKVPSDENEKNAKRRAAKRSATASDAMGQAVSVPLRAMVDAHSSEALRRSLHPFEHVTATLTAAARVRSGARPLTEIVEDIADLRKTLLEDAKEGARLAKAAASAAEAAEVPEKVLTTMEARLAARGTVLEELRNCQRAFRKLPTVSLATPTAVLVGAPNVGKSTLVRALSTGEPEVGNYAFTTRGLSLGHVYAGAEGKDLLGQVMDTPGLLDRADDERNEMEELTMATMNHLPSAVVFVVDLSGHAGDAKSSPEDQLRVRNDLRARFPKRPWIDVVAKGDLYDAATCAPAPEGALLVSAKDDLGLDDLRARVASVLDIVARVTRRQRELAAEGAAAETPR